MQVFPATLFFIMKTFTLIACLLALYNHGPKPGIEWNKTSVNFGTVKQGDTLYASFKYYNRSDTGFTIENIQASCGCVLSQWSNKTLQVGDSAEIRVAFDTHHKNKYHEKTINIYSSHGLYELILKAHIEKQ